MMLKKQRWLFAAMTLFALLLNMSGMSITTQAAAHHRQTVTSTRVVAKAAVPTQHSQAQTAPAAFMHRPYYGSRTVLQRTYSYMDHDKPWYENDGIFVRYDGARWTGDSITSCTGRVNCYDGHNGYDLDLSFEPVLSVAAGTVTRAGWYNPLDHNNGFGLWVAVDHGNGYLSAYGHLSAVTVAVGDTVGTQWQLGVSGTTGSSTGPHLHLSIFDLPSWLATDPFGWTGSYADPNVVPDNYLWVGDPSTGTTVPDLNSTGNAPYAGATLVDDGGAGWSSTGAWTGAAESTDVNGNLHWTATSSAAVTASATWQPTIPSDGYYEVGVYVDDTHASSSWVPYTVYSADSNSGAEISHTVYVDESHIGLFEGPFGWENTGPKWVAIGTYYFKASLHGRVVATNATGESGLQISADGVEFVPIAGSGGPSYAFAVTQDSTPTTMPANATTTVNLTLKNTSNFSWSARGSSPVQLLYRWLDAHSHVVMTSNPIALSQDVAIGSTLSLSVSVQTLAQGGNYTLQWDMLQGLTVFSQHGASPQNDSVRIVQPYNESFAALTLPHTIVQGSVVIVSVSVENTGSLTWSASGSTRIVLGYRWFDSTGKPVDGSLVDTSNVGLLSSDVAPGASASITIRVNIPAQAGTYSVVYDLQIANPVGSGTWFSSQGSTPLTLTVPVVPPPGRGFRHL